MRIYRTPWPENFPKVFTHCSVEERDNHTSYKKAKSGDHNNAYVLASDLLNSNTLQKIKNFITTDMFPILVPVGAEEKDGYNAIPSAMTANIHFYLSALSATEHDVDIDNFVQINRVGHTRAPMWQRIVTPPLFTGKVQEGRNYILIDDHTGTGSTFANLRGYIEHNGGRVVAFIALTASQEAEIIYLSPATTNMLYSKYGTELDQLWQQYFGYGINCLTAIEARTIARQPSVDAIRNFLSKATDEANSKGMQTITVS